MNAVPNTAEGPRRRTTENRLLDLMANKLLETLKKSFTGKKALFQGTRGLTSNL